MESTKHEAFTVIGISARVRNDNPEEIGQLWKEFYAGNCAARLPNTQSPDVYCIYHSYAGDHLDPFDMTIGYRVASDTPCPAGLDRVEIPKQKFVSFKINGPLPDALIQQWAHIWQCNLDRAFIADFDVYDANRSDHVTTYVGTRVLAVTS